MTGTVFEGRWSGGEKASAVPISVRFEAEGLSIQSSGAQLDFWKYKDLQAGAPVASGCGDVLLRNTKTPRATLYIQGPGIGELVISQAPQTSQRSQRFRIVSFSLIATAIAAALAGFLLFGRLSASKIIGRLIPVSIADRIGLQSTEMFGPIAPACAGQPGNAALQRILDRLQSSGNYGRSFKLHVAKANIPNAFALPGGHIVLLSALVKEAKSPEEVAGVLAHEMGHEIEYDPEALVVRNLGMQTLISLLTGQSGGQSALSAGAILLQLRYSRDAERSADAHAIEILRNARIAPKPTGDFFQRHASGGSGSFLNYLSTHPSSKERAQLFFSQPHYDVQPLLSAGEWADAQAICGGN